MLFDGTKQVLNALWKRRLGKYFVLILASLILFTIMALLLSHKLRQKVTKKFSHVYMLSRKQQKGKSRHSRSNHFRGHQKLHNRNHNRGYQRPRPRPRQGHFVAHSRKRAFQRPSQQQVYSGKGGKFSSKGETECRRVLESFFNKPFPNSRPSFLQVTKSSHLELDCYNKDLKLAVEYQGKQHYKFIKHFHHTQNGYHAQRYRDQLKALLCKKHHVYLIHVPYTIPVDDIEPFLRQKIIKYLKSREKYPGKAFPHRFY